MTVQCYIYVSNFILGCPMYDKVAIIHFDSVSQTSSNHTFLFIQRDQNSYYQIISYYQIKTNISETEIVAKYSLSFVVSDFNKVVQ